MFRKLRNVSVHVAMVAILGFSILRTQPNPMPASVPQSRCDLVVLAGADDPYYPLAVEIATAEDAPVVRTLSDALACSPEFLLWVVSPGFLSDAVMIEYGLTMKAQTSVISSGIITGSSLDQARSLWERRSQVHGQDLVIVNASNPAAHIEEGRIAVVTQTQRTGYGLTPQSLQDALKTADYLTFTGHGGNSYLRIDEDTKVTSADIPVLDPIVVSTGSCQTLRPWNEDSIARRFVDQGAAAYAGFVFSPNEGYLIGELDDLPFRYTWPDFPIGHVLQVQNRGTLQGFARFPYQFLLGDPRIALQTEPAYPLVEDRDEGEWRILTYEGVPAGTIPLRIEGGADYHFVNVPGITTAADGDPFYNSQLQMVAMQGDKLILVIHEGGDLIVEMRRHAPWYWYPVDILLDSLDHTLIFTQQSGGDILVSVAAVIPLLWVGWQALKRRLAWREIRLAMSVGLGAAIAQTIYAFLRLDRVTITSKAVAFSPLSILAALVVVTCGTVIYLRARRWTGRSTALLVMTFASWAPMVYGVVILGLGNMAVFRPKLGAALYNYALGLSSLPSFLVTVALFGLVLRSLARATNFRVASEQHSATSAQSEQPGR